MVTGTITCLNPEVPIREMVRKVHPCTVQVQVQYMDLSSTCTDLTEVAQVVKLLHDSTSIDAISRRFAVSSKSQEDVQDSKRSDVFSFFPFHFLSFSVFLFFFFSFF